MNPNSGDLGVSCENIGSHNFPTHDSKLKTQLVETIVGSEFQSQPCLTIHNTCKESLEQSSCCDIGIRVLTQ
eukprot:scaffold204783_cov73-Cyclotella_meneghiniana.AAC.1